MPDPDRIFEYGWENSELTCAHAYLIPVIIKAVYSVLSTRGTLLKEHLKIFDAGCGNGALAGELISCGLNVTGCDASEMGINQARTRYPEGHFELYSVYDDLPARFGMGWDIVISSEVIEHLYNPRALVKNAYDLLCPSGTVIITTPYHGYFKNLIMALLGKLDQHFTALWDGGHIKFWSYKSLKYLLGEAGFENIQFIGAGRLPFLWKSMVVIANKP